MTLVRASVSFLLLIMTRQKAPNSKEMSYDTSIVALINVWSPTSQNLVTLAPTIHQFSCLKNQAIHHQGMKEEEKGYNIWQMMHPILDHL